MRGRAAALCALLGCTGAEPPSRSAAAATVNNPVKEAELTTVVLTADAEHRLGIQTAVVARTDVPRTRTYPGSIEAIPGSGASIAAPVAGLLIASMSLVPGKKVQRGEILMKLKPLVAAESDVLARAERDVSVAKSRVDAARVRSDRLAALARDGATSLRAAEEAGTELAVAQADLVAATSRHQRVRENPFASDVALPLRAPNDGTVLRLTAAPGQVVAAGAPLVEIARVDRAWVRVALYAGDLDTIARSLPGTAVRLGSHDARTVTAVDAPAIADPASATVELVYAVDNADAAFLPGQRALVTLPMTGTSVGIAVPLASVLYDIHGGAWVYTTSAPHVFTRRRIEVRDVLGESAILDRGPDPGAVIVTAGASELYGTEFGSK